MVSDGRGVECPCMPHCTNTMMAADLTGLIAAAAHYMGILIHVHARKRHAAHPARKGPASLHEEHGALEAPLLAGTHRRTIKEPSQHLSQNVHTCMHLSFSLTSSPSGQ
jgi:hypothetical protein